MNLSYLFRGLANIKTIYEIILSNASKKNVRSFKVKRAHV